MSKKIKFENPFDEAIANCPASTDWAEQRNMIMNIILSYYDDMTFFRVAQTKNNDFEDRIRIIFFGLFNCLYVWHEVIENGLLESGQLDKVLNYESNLSIVLYSNITNIKPFAPIANKLLNERMLYPVETNLEK